jgi:hypothetical protein
MEAMNLSVHILVPHALSQVVESHCSTLIAFVIMLDG